MLPGAASWGGPLRPPQRGRPGSRCDELAPRPPGLDRVALVARRRTPMARERDRKDRGVDPHRLPRDSLQIFFRYDAAQSKNAAKALHSRTMCDVGNVMSAFKCSPEARERSSAFSKEWT